MLVATFFEQLLSGQECPLHDLHAFETILFHITCTFILMCSLLSFSFSLSRAGIARRPKLAVSTRERLAAQRGRFRHSAQVAKNGMRRLGIVLLSYIGVSVSSNIELAAFSGFPAFHSSIAP